MKTHYAIDFPNHLALISTVTKKIRVIAKNKAINKNLSWPDLYRGIRTFLDTPEGIVLEDILEEHS